MDCFLDAELRGDLSASSVVEVSLAPITQTILVELGTQGPPGAAPTLRLWVDSFDYTLGMEITPSKPPIGRVFYFLDGLFQLNLVVPDDLEDGDFLQLMYLYAS